MLTKITCAYTCHGKRGYNFYLLTRTNLNQKLYFKSSQIRDLFKLCFNMVEEVASLLATSFYKILY